MTSSLRSRPSLAMLGALLALAAGCADSTTSPVAPPVAPPQTPATPPAGFPAVPGTAHVYASTGTVDALYAGSYGVSFASRFVLDADGTFRLQFVRGSAGFLEYGGRYARTDSRVTFDWDGWSTAGPWGATGTLLGDNLSVDYNLVMEMTDFIDGDYVRVPATQ